MGLNILDANVIAIMALVASTITGWLTWRSNARRDKTTAIITSAQTAIDAYDHLCKDLQSQIDKSNSDILRLETKLHAMEAQHTLDRSVWAAEKASLELQIQTLRAENAALRMRLDALQAPRS
jgi:hypothetical protein